MAKTLLESLNCMIETLTGVTAQLPCGRRHRRDIDQISFIEGDLCYIEEETSFVGGVLGITPMQCVLFAAIVENTSGRRTDVKEVAEFLGMSYLKFLSYSEDLQALKDNGLIRMGDDGKILVMKEVLKALMENRAYERPAITGIPTQAILRHFKDTLDAVRSDQMTDDIALSDIDRLIELNPTTSIARGLRNHLKRELVSDVERYMFYALLHMAFNNKRELFTMDDLQEYFTRFPTWDRIRDYFNDGSLELMRQGLIERENMDGILSKEVFLISKKVLEEVFSDVESWRHVGDPTIALTDCQAKPEKHLYYNDQEQAQVSRLESLLEPERLKEVYEAMKDKGMRTGFTCLFFGTPGTGKTETVYQLARRTGRKILEADVAKLKNCYVGETEKNVRRLFRDYRTACKENEQTPILLFNEADAIFGMRMEGAVKAVDKMENSVQNIILQEMEAFHGIMIATTNLTRNLDPAFERRFLFKIRFSRPTLQARAQIWKSMLPDLSVEEAQQLAQSFNFSGGQIENVVRKRTVDSVLEGTVPGFDQIMGYCREESLNKKPERPRVGFVK